MVRLVPLGATLTSPVADLTPYEVTTAVWHLFPISCVIAMGGLFVSTLVRQRSTANGIMGIVVLRSFFLRAFADSAQEPTLLQLKALSIFNYFSAITILSYGPQP